MVPFKARATTACIKQANTHTSHIHTHAVLQIQYHLMVSTRFFHTKIEHDTLRQHRKTKAEILFKCFGTTLVSIEIHWRSC